MRPFRFFALGLGAFLSAYGQRLGAPTTDLDKASPDELFSVQVTSVGRKAQKLSKAPAAVFVLTAEDIRRSGATCIPEALQGVPGLTVLQIDGRSWAVSARGGARQYADKILVMIDGRSLYMPFFSGVVWDAIDVPLSDIEQIEIVRGPGAVMWGPNAVNGVINIITKRATATTGGQVKVTSGNELRNGTEARWGAAPNDRMAYRVWGKFDYRNPAFDSPGYFRFDNQFTVQDPSLHNVDSGAGRAGFRVDGQSGERDQWMVQGDGYKLDRQDATAYAILAPISVQRLQEHTDYQGGDLQAKWTHTASTGNESELQFTYSRNDWNYEFLSVHLNNLTLDYQKRIQTGEYNEIYWGAGYQRYWDDTRAGNFMQFTPARSDYHNGDVVFRDEWQVVPDRWTLSAGVRLDYGSYRRLEYQPSFRLLYTPSSQASAWLSVSRAVRTPSRLDRDAQLNEGMAASQPFPTTATLLGNSQFRSEVERSLEAGYRIQAGQRWSIDVSAFWSYYGRLRLIEAPWPPPLLFTPDPVFSLRLTMANGGSSRSYGGEIWGSFQVQRRWKLIPSYSYLNETRWLPASAYYQLDWDGTPASLPHQGALRSQHDLSRTVQFDLMARVRSHDNWLNLPGALLLAARLSWRPVRGGEFSATIRNLTNRKIVESYPDVVTCALPLRRTFAIGWTQRF